MPIQGRLSCLGKETAFGFLRYSELSHDSVPDGSFSQKVVDNLFSALATASRLAFRCYAVGNTYGVRFGGALSATISYEACIRDSLEIPGRVSAFSAGCLRHTSDENT